MSCLVKIKWSADIECSSKFFDKVESFSGVGVLY